MDYSEFFKAMLKLDELDFNHRKIIVGCPSVLPELSSGDAIKQHMENILFELKQASHKSADNWFFYDVDNLPESLPDYIEIK